jgi:hypothetical protein
LSERIHLNLPRTDAIYQQFNGIAGAIYFVAVAGLGMTALTFGDERRRRSISREGC